MYLNRSKIDLELLRVLENTILPKISQSQYTVYISPETALKNKADTIGNNTTNTCQPLNTIENFIQYKNVLYEVINAIKKGDLSGCENSFTSDGKKMFDELISYGQAKILDISDTIRFIKIHDDIIARPVPMAFSFKNNKRKFVENVVFTFNSDCKIDAVSFSLIKVAIY